MITRIINYTNNFSSIFYKNLKKYSVNLSRLSREANYFPQDSFKQNQYLKALLENKEYSKIIQRFEESLEDFALHSPDAVKIYIEALNKTGQGEKALLYLYKGIPRQDKREGISKLFSLEQNNSHFNPNPNLSNPNSNFTNNFSNIFGTRENPLFVVSKPATPTARERFWTSAKIFVSLWLTLAIVSVYFDEIAKLGGAAGGGARKQIFTEITPENETKFTFADVQGVDEAKEELQEIVEFLKDPQRFTRLGGKLPKGVLLTGPPGTGKTLLARAVAGEAGVPFFLSSGSEFDEMFVGVGAKRVRQLFAAAKKSSPCIVFIDEIDAVGSMRNPKDQQYAKMTLNQLLVEMDGFSQNEGLIVIGATNFPESLDHALVRPGRFDRNVVVTLPDVKGRQDILKVHTKNVILGPDVKLNIIARGTPGFSGAELSNLINYAAVRAASLNKTAVTMLDLEWAKDRIIMGNLFKS